LIVLVLVRSSSAWSRTSSSRPSSAIQGDRPSLVFLHGLGESGLSFSKAFERPELARFNLVVPDLLGFGRTEAACSGPARRYHYRSSLLIA